MATTAGKLTVSEFQEKFGHSDRAYEFWYGEAMPKSMPTWVHGLLRAMIVHFLKEAGFRAASEVELRIDPDARPRPDVIATRSKPSGAYPTEAVDVVVEIVSENEPYPHLKEKCCKYQAWAFKHVFVVDPSDRSVKEWNGALVETDSLVGIPVARIWHELDQQYSES